MELSESPVEEKTCIICFVPGTNDFVICPYCNFETCKECLKRFILEGIGEAYCMNVSCKKYFTRSFLGHVFGKMWITRATKGSYKAFLQEKQLEAQKAKIPEIMNFMKQQDDLARMKEESILATARIKEIDAQNVPYIKLREDVYNSIIRLLKSKKKYTWHKRRRYYIGYMDAPYFNLYDKLILNIAMGEEYTDGLLDDDIKRKLSEDVKDIVENASDVLKKKMDKYRSVKDILFQNLVERRDLNRVKYLYGAAKMEERIEEEIPTGPSYIQGCPIKDCRGLIEKETYRCSICFVVLCKKCRVEKTSKSEGKEEEGKPSSSHFKQKHICKPEDIETVKLIKKDSKPCPKCATSIFKISGCFGKDIPILQYNGSIKMSQDIQIGDTLVGDDGEKRTVLDVCSGIDDLYKVCQSNGMEYVVNSKHTLLLNDGKDDNILEISAEDCINLENVFCIDTSSPRKKYSFSIDYLGKGEYFGWLLDGNHRFIGVDGTLLKNCSQIWCTKCHIAFDWNTGRIDNGRIHNPHYFEFLKEKGANHNDDEYACGDEHLPREEQYMFRLRTPLVNKKILNDNDVIQYNLVSISRSLALVDELNEHIRSMKIYNRNIEKSLLVLGVRYLKKEIDIRQWKEKIYEKNESIIKNNFNIEIYTSLRLVLTEAYRKFYTDLGSSVDNLNTLEELKEYVSEKSAILKDFMAYLEEIRSYFNKSIIDEYTQTTMKKGSFFVFGDYWDVMQYSEMNKGFKRPKDYGQEDESDYVYYHHAVLPEYDMRFPPAGRPLTFDSEGEIDEEEDEYIEDDMDYL